MKLMQVVDIMKIDDKSALVRFDTNVDDETLQSVKQLMQWAISEAQKRFDTGKTLPGEGQIN